MRPRPRVHNGDLEAIDAVSRYQVVGLYSGAIGNGGWSCERDGPFLLLFLLLLLVLVLRLVIVVVVDLCASGHSDAVFAI